MKAGVLRAVLAATTAFGLVAGFAVVGQAAQKDNHQPELARVRAATAAYHDVAAAEAAGYEKFLDCFQSAAGGMGQHYVQLNHLDAVVDALDPEAMVYEAREDGLHLVAVEYIVPKPAWHETNPPSLFGQTFHDNSTLNIWMLHAYIWRPNPIDMFADFNPSVRPCP
jgi:hypothetical protein